MDALAKRAEPCYIGGGLYATQLENSCIAISVGSPNKAPVCYFDQSVISNLAGFANSLPTEMKNASF